MLVTVAQLRCLVNFRIYRRWAVFISRFLIVVHTDTLRPSLHSLNMETPADLFFFINSELG